MSKTSYRPMNAFITIEAIHMNEKTASGLIKSDEMMAAEREKFQGLLKVVHTGPLVPLDDKGVKQIEPGDEVILGNAAVMSNIEVDGVEYWQVDSYQVLGVIKK